MYLNFSVLIDEIINRILLVPALLCVPPLRSSFSYFQRPVSLQLRLAGNSQKCRRTRPVERQRNPRQTVLLLDQTISIIKVSQLEISYCNYIANDICIAIHSILLSSSCLGISLLPQLIYTWLAPGSPSSPVRTYHLEVLEIDLDETLRKSKKKNQYYIIPIILPNHFNYYFKFSANVV